MEGLRTFRVRRWPPRYLPEQVDWGPETTWLDDKRYSGERDLPPRLRGADGPDLRQPGGPQRQLRDPMAAARDIRETFCLHGEMNDEGDRRADRRRPHLR